MKMVAARWYAQNEDTNPEGCLLSGEEAFEAERKALAEMGAPDTDAIIFHDVQPVDRDDAEVTADVPETFFQWLHDEDMAWLMEE